MKNQEAIDKQTLFTLIDALPPGDLEQLYQHVKQRLQVVSLHSAIGTHHTILESSHPTPADTIREEVNAVVDDAIALVQHKREARSKKR
jgi:hypothetical protein